MLPSTHVSKAHAEIYTDGLTLRVRDLGSRNGTFLNREPVTDGPLHDGDVLHVGDYEFRVARDLPEEDDARTPRARSSSTAPLSRHFVSGARQVRELIDQGAVTMFFQPIVTLPAARVAAYEALGRGRLPDLPESPVELFDLAGALGPDAQAELSRLFRRKAVELVRDRPEPPLLFLNTHPVELERPGLLESLEELRTFAPQVDLVLEIHESALAQTDFITWLRGRLLEINVGAGLRRLRGRPGAALRAGRGAAPLPEVRPPLRHRPRPRARLAAAAGGLAGGGRARAAGEDGGGGRRDGGRGRGVHACGLLARPGLPLRAGRCRSRSWARADVRDGRERGDGEAGRSG